MSSLDEVAYNSRQMLRDFGTFFEENYAGPNNSSTLRLSHPLVAPTNFSVVDNASGTALEPTVDYLVNPRIGLLKLVNPSFYPEGIYVSGLYYEWFLDEDLAFYAQQITNEHLHHRQDVSGIEDIQGVEVEVLGMGALVAGLWGLLNELAMDINVMSPEGINIPASSRYQQVYQLISQWEERYNHKAGMLNVGLDRIENFQLRRKSRITNRLVPIYRSREYDDHRWPVRVRPAIDPLGPGNFDPESNYWAQDTSWGNWET